MPPRELRAIAADYDRTLTPPDSALVEPDAREALARARDQGLRVIVVSGRDIAFLVDAVGDITDAIVGENGCVVRTPDGHATIVGGLADDLARALDALGGAEGTLLRSFDAEREPLLRKLLQRMPGAKIERNRDRLMVLPEGVDKAVGLLAALRALGVPASDTVAFGDGENDVTMLRAVGRGIAVANAVPELRALADEVTREPGGRGVASWVRENVTEGVRV